MFGGSDSALNNFKGAANLFKGNALAKTYIDHLSLIPTPILIHRLSLRYV